ncbi:GreA/GreB family elongation factor [Kaistella montana]|uniref:GreA/GreB family elongation factor n=1 Tax=Kaistella montana TaxID=1849733 RepID=A0ABW5KA28_9FLAO|nr:GreA/GreB family elongation factor [Kaistella montana]MCQ4036303.1 GreA/GreB family elongation factor [Kaistella montana]
MSRGFVKEGDQEEIPLIPPRADLPPGTVNFVTEIGYAQLLAERDQMIHERDNTLISDENENRIAVNLINAKLQLLLDRISSAKIANLAKQPKNIVRFGAEVYFTVDSDPKVQHYQIVGVDEANVAEGKIAFISPIAKIFMDRKVGDRVTLKLGKAEKQFEIVSIKY